MASTRRIFLKQLGTTVALSSAGAFPAAAITPKGFTSITILHTNDQHSRIDPFPMDGGRLQGQGGAARRAALIEKIRKEREHVLLFDSGDIFQGTPYFNLYKGEPEIKLMTAMGYDAATIGNHDFDGGIDNLALQMSKAGFPMLNANYDVSATPLKSLVKPYQIFKKGGIKVGVFGLGIELKGLVPEALYAGTVYNDPVQAANQWARFLKEEEKCHYVVVLSHLGYRYKEDKISDIELAKQTKNIDLILGGHTHTFLDKPTQVMNLDQQPVFINQVGWAGVVLGRLEIHFDHIKNRISAVCTECQSLKVGPTN